MLKVLIKFASQIQNQFVTDQADGVIVHESYCIADDWCEYKEQHNRQKEV